MIVLFFIYTFLPFLAFRMAVILFVIMLSFVFAEITILLEDS